MRFLRSLLASGCVLLIVAFGPRTISAQGVTTAAVSGRVTDAEGRPLPGIPVVLTNLSTGTSRSGLSNAEGHFLVSGLQVGGPYRLQATAIGQAAFTQDDIQLTLGQNLYVPIRMQVQAVQLAALEVISDRTSQQVINPKRTGAEQLVTEHQLANLPTQGRNFTDFIQLSPLVGAGGGATSVGAQNNRFNNIQIDGAIAQDLFGLGSTGQPGGQAGARSISIEAVKQYQVLAAPYDVRQSGFSGGLINAVTKSGTNDWHGSLYGYYKNLDLVRETIVVDTTKLIFGEFANKLFGGSLGGPIVQDRAHFFVTGEWEDDNRPASGIAVGRESPAQLGFNDVDAQRLQQILEQRGLSAGGFGPRSVENPNRNLFARVDAQLSPTHTLTLRNNWVRATDDITVNRNPGSFFSLESNWYFFESTTNSAAAQLNSSFNNGMFNEMTFGSTRIRDRRTPNVRYPELNTVVRNTIGGVNITKTLVTGAEFFSQANELDQDSWEFTNNFSFNVGSHRVTLGVHDEYFKFRNLFASGITGRWTFGSLDSLQAGLPNAYTANPAYQPGLDLNASFSVNSLGLYAQTEFSPMPNLNFTLGLRYDMPTFPDKPADNTLFSGDPAFAGRRLDEMPSGNGIVSPRLGFNWDVFDNRDLQVRGGAGIFTGRQPFVWMSNLFSNNGLQQVTISCSRTANNLPTFTLDPDAQPTTCAAGGLPAPARAAINLINPDFKFPHNWRFNLAADKRLVWGIVGTAEFLYTRAAQQVFLRELNLVDTPVNTTQGGRQMFGTVRAGALAATANNNTAATPTRKSANFLQVVELTNSDQDRSWTVTAQLQKRYSNGVDLNASYTYMDAKDISGLTSSIATSNIGFNPVAGSPNSPVLSTSDYETPHKIVLSGSYDITSWLRASMFYIGNSGDGYAFVYDGDVNADGFEAVNANNRYNDLLYVPTGQADITLTDPADWTRINNFIEGVGCLKENRGRIMQRNACQEPWRNLLNARFTFSLPTTRGQRAQIATDISNVLNLFNEEWGRSTGIPNPTLELLELRGWDATNNRGIFRPTGALRLKSTGDPNHWTTFSGASRWQASVGVRYIF